ncbi:hypothetical protein BC829DRAFT_151439 [Chytridium lagenaria]|nr:hypothetical protein BC829DRAFT_151439 [Chytridium lagenaria]
MSQIATFTEPESIPSLEDAPEVTLSEQATEGSIQFLKELGSTVRKELFFTDKVPLFSKEDGERTQVGHSVIIVSEGIARGKSCYFVSINTEAKLSSTTSVSSTITAYVSTQLDTISQSVYEISTNSERFEEHIMEAILDPTVPVFPVGRIED